MEKAKKISVSSDFLFDGEEEMFKKALLSILGREKVNPATIQRFCACGYETAKRALAWMEAQDYVSQADSKGQRKVLITLEEFAEKYGSLKSWQEELESRFF